VLCAVLNLLHVVPIQFHHYHSLHFIDKQNEAQRGSVTLLSGTAKLVELCATYVCDHMTTHVSTFSLCAEHARIQGQLMTGPCGNMHVCSCEHASHIFICTVCPRIYVHVFGHTYSSYKLGFLAHLAGSVGRACDS